MAAHGLQHAQGAQHVYCDESVGWDRDVSGRHQRSKVEHAIWPYPLDHALDHGWLSDIGRIRRHACRESFVEIYPGYLCTLRQGVFRQMAAGETADAGYQDAQ